jgi:hypothetical protein
MPKIEINGSLHISKVADTYGFRTIKPVVDENSSLKSKRKNLNLLFHGDRYNAGDIVTVPDFAEKDEQGSTEKNNVFKLDGEKLFLRIRILGEDFTAIANADYELTVPGLPNPVKGKTDAKGQIEAEIPRHADSASLAVRVPAAKTGAPADGAVAGDVPCTWALKIGGLNPIMENAPDKWCVAGVQQRLNNLAINCGSIDGINGPITTNAVKAFQKLFGLKIDGKPGQYETQPKLVEVHDKPDSVLGPKTRTRGRLTILTRKILQL